MPKATLEFTLPEEKNELKLATEGAKLLLVISSLEQWLRTKIKYNPNNMSEDKLSALIDVQGMLGELIIKEGVEELLNE
jgi:hypothetical protein